MPEKILYTTLEYTDISGKISKGLVIFFRETWLAYIISLMFLI